MTESVFPTRLSSHAVPGRRCVVFGAAWTYLRLRSPPLRVMVLPMITLTVTILTGSLVGRPVKNGDARLKHTATEKTAAVPVAEAESTKVLFRGAFRHREESLEKPPRGDWTRLD